MKRYTLITVMALAAASGWAQFGYIPATEDQLRGVPMASTPFSGAELPESVDLSEHMPPPGNQGKQSSCVAWATTYAMKSFQEKNELQWSFTDGSGRVDQSHVFSPAFIYNQINNGRDAGSLFIDALNVLSQQGAATLADMPYDPNDYRTPPDSSLVSRAKRYRIDYWRRVNVADIKEVKAQLNANYPVMFGAMVDGGFTNAGPRFIWSRSEGEKLGGHAMLLVGYDDRKRAFRLLNSWGRQWGDRGYSWISYDFFPKVTREGYVAKDARNDVTPPVTTTDTRPPRRDDNTPPDIFRPPIIKPPAPRVDFRITGVFHNMQDRNGLPFMKIDGTLSVPPGLARQDQIVVHFYFNDGTGRKGYAVASRAQQFSTINGTAAVGTMVYPVPPEGLTTQWTVWIPYSALALMPGTMGYDYYGRAVYQPRMNYLVLEPVLFLDGCGYASGGLWPFAVTQ